MSRIIATFLFVAGITSIGISIVGFVRHLDPNESLQISLIPAREPAPIKQVIDGQIQLVNRLRDPIDVHALSWC